MLAKCTSYRGMFCCKFWLFVCFYFCCVSLQVHHEWGRKSSIRALTEIPILEVSTLNDAFKSICTLWCTRWHSDFKLRRRVKEHFVTFVSDNARAFNTFEILNITVSTWQNEKVCEMLQLKEIKWLERVTFYVLKSQYSSKKTPLHKCCSGTIFVILEWKNRDWGFFLSLVMAHGQ